MPSFFKQLLFLAVIAITFSGCVKIETGATVEEATETNEVRAKQIRSQWAERLSRVNSDKDRAIAVKDYVDSVSAVYIRYGFTVADEWRKGNEGRGKEVEASEMRQVVDAWVKTQRPILMAYEDNMEYGIGLVRESKSSEPVPQSALVLLDSLASQYYNTYSAVFYPNHNVQSYEEELLEAQKRHRIFSEAFNAVFKKF